MDVLYNILRKGDETKTSRFVASPQDRKIERLTSRSLAVVEKNNVNLALSEHP